MFTKILHRPALAIVISVIILFLGGLAIKTLPISQFPSVAPPSVVVTVAYPGASANVLVDSVLIILEQAINGVQDMRYMASAATSAGEATIQIIFEPGTDPNVAVLNVNNRINIVKNRLPPLVEREGIIVMQAMTSMLMYVNVYSTDKGVDQNFLYNYAFVNILPEIKRVRGIGTATILGSRQYAMRVWLNLDRMRAYNVSSEDVMKAVGEQSMIGSPGRLGQATGRTSQTVEYVLTWVGRYNKPEQYENIILKANPDGEILRLKDVAKVELSASFYNLYSDIDGHPSAAIVLKQIPGSNAATVIEEVKEKLKEIKADVVPPRHGLPGQLRRLRVPGGLHREGAPHPVRGLRAGGPGGLPVPRRLAFHADPDPGGPGLPDRDLLLHADVRPLDQPDHALRAGAGDRGRGGRRDRGGRGGACQDGREAPLALSGDHGGRPRDQRRDHRHHPGDDGGLHPGDLHDRAGRRLLPPVRPHDGHVHRPLRRRGPDAHAGPLRDAPQAPHGPREEARAAGHAAASSSTAASRRSRAVMPRSCAGSSRAAR